MLTYWWMKRVVLDFYKWYWIFLEILGIVDDINTFQISNEEYCEDGDI
jgi:hypothetical protein